MTKIKWQADGYFYATLRDWDIQIRVGPMLVPTGESWDVDPKRITATIEITRGDWFHETHTLYAHDYKRDTEVMLEAAKKWCEELIEREERINRSL